MSMNAAEEMVWNRDERKKKRIVEVAQEIMITNVGRCGIPFDTEAAIKDCFELASAFVEKEFS